jgi:hypothetical protein
MGRHNYYFGDTKKPWLTLFTRDYLGYQIKPVKPVGTRLKPLSCSLVKALTATTDDWLYSLDFGMVLVDS